MQCIHCFLSLIYLIAHVNSFTITNQNTFAVDVRAPNGVITAVISMGGATFSSFGTYTILQSGSTSVYFTLTYPTTRLLSTGVGTLTGDFLVSASLH